MVALANPIENPCFGCGPAHRRGLHLSFERLVADDGTDELRTSYTPQPDEVGWPGVFHTGLHFTVLYEVSYWAALTLGGHLMVSDGPVTYARERLPRVGQRHTARATVTARSAERLTIVATDQSESGKPCGRLESEWVYVHRSTIERSGLSLPPYLLDELID